MYIGKSPQTGAYSILDSLTASATASYTMQLNSVNYIAESAQHLLVSLNGSIQKPNSSFTVSGSTLTFSEALTSADSIDFIYALGNVLDIGTPSDSTISTAKLINNSVTGAKFNADVISGQTALTSEPADTDEFLVSDAGVIKRIDYSLIKGGGGFVKLAESYSSSAVAEVDFNDKFTSSYSIYRVVGSLAVENSGASLEMRYKTDSSTQLTNASYQYIENGRRITSSSEEDAHNGHYGTTSFTLGFGINNGSTLPVVFDLVFYDPRQTTFSYKLFNGHVTYYGSDSKFYHHTIGGRYVGSGDATGIRLMPSAGDFLRNDVTLYGLEGTGS